MNFDNTESKVVISLLLIFILASAFTPWTYIFALPVGCIVGWWIARRHLK